MESLKNVDSVPLSASHHHVTSSTVRGTEQGYKHMQRNNKNLEEENEALKKQVESLMTIGEQLKIKQQRVHSMLLDRDNMKSQLMHCKNELLVLGKKIRVQQMDLRRKHKQTEFLKQQVQSVKHKAVSQRTQQQQLKEHLEQVIKERDSLNSKWLQCQNECSELSNKITSQQSILNKKDYQCKEQVKQIHLLKLENQKLEQERGIHGNEADNQKRALRKCKENLQIQREKLKEMKTLHAVENKLGKRIVILQQKPVRKSCQDVSLQKIEVLQKELISQTEELRRTQKLCEELKQNLTKISVQFQECQATMRSRKEKLKAVTAERNMYKGETEKMRKELAATKKLRLGEKLCNWAAKKKKDMKLSSGVKSRQSCPPPSPKQSRLPTTSSPVETKLMIIGTHI